jgi:hypothetical protein
MYTISETLENNGNGLFYGNRIILPFKANFLKIIIDDDMITDFSPGGGKVFINETEKFTEIYFHQLKDLRDKVSKYEAIKMLLTEKDVDIFNSENHLKISVYLEESQKLKIEKTGKDVLFIE